MATDAKTSRSLRSSSVAALVNTVIIILLIIIQFKYTDNAVLLLLWPMQCYNKLEKNFQHFTSNSFEVKKINKFSTKKLPFFSRF